MYLHVHLYLYLIFLLTFDHLYFPLIPAESIVYTIVVHVTYEHSLQNLKSFQEAIKIGRISGEGPGVK